MSDWPLGYRKLELDEVDSTNAQARRMAERGETGPVWIIARKQTAGRGRRGRSWQTGPGNLATTLLFRPAARQGDYGQLSFAAALSVYDLAIDIAPHAVIATKWPNDVLANGRKLAGILLESGADWLAVGIGVNLRTAPKGLGGIALSECGVNAPSPEDALTSLALHWACWYDEWVRNGFEPLRKAWLERTLGLGSVIRARLSHKERSGVFEGIDSKGSLLLSDNGQMHVIAAGEVFF